MKLGEIKERYDALNRLGEKRLPATLSFAVSRNLRAMADDAKAYETQREKLCREYAEKDGDGTAAVENGAYVFSKENRELFDKEIENLRNTEVTIDTTKIPESTIRECEASERFDILTVSEIYQMEFMFGE